LAQAAIFVKNAVELQLSVKEMKEIFTWFDGEEGPFIFMLFEIYEEYDIIVIRGE
jgi:hypothetical protein